MMGRISIGRMAVSKTADAGSIHAAPAICSDKANYRKRKPRGCR